MATQNREYLASLWGNDILAVIDKQDTKPIVARSLGGYSR